MDTIQNTSLFSVYFFNGGRDFINVFEEILAAYDGEIMLVVKEEEIKVPLIYLGEIIKKYHSAECIDWNETIENISMPLEYWMAEFFKPTEKWDCTFRWKCLIVNARNNIILFLRNFKNEINWCDVQTYAEITWTLELIKEFKEYLIFTDTAIRNGYKTKGFFNIVGQEHHPTQSPKFPFQILSAAKNVEWDIYLIAEFAHYWNWDYLSANIYIPFTPKIIEEFKNQWNWTFLSANRAIYWSSVLLTTFHELLDEATLSTNTSVDWGKGISSLRGDKIDWARLCMNRNFDINIINRKCYSQKVVWKNPKEKQYLSIIEASWQIYPKVNEEYVLIPKYNKDWKYYYEDAQKFKLNVPPSLSANTNVEWTDEILSKHHTKLDFWIIALRGKISPNIIERYAAFFDEVRHIRTSSQKHSDWGTYRVFHYHTGWENLVLNPNFTDVDSLLSLVGDRRIRIQTELDTFNLNSGDSENPDDYISEGGTWITVKEIFTNPKIGFRTKLDYSLL